jgi:hypothetical protein
MHLLSDCTVQEMTEFVESKVPPDVDYRIVCELIEARNADGWDWR